MIKFTATMEGKKVLGLGLSHKNLKLLKSGKPIHIDLAEIGHTDEIFIFSGRNEAIMAEDLKEFIGEKTKVHAP